MAPATVDTFVEEFARALERRDDEACAALWGRAGVVLADRFEAVADDPTELILERVELTDAITRVLVRYSFVDGAGEHLVDGDFEYVLRRGPSGVLCHVGVNISAEPNLAELAERRGFRPPT